MATEEVQQAPSPAPLEIPLTGHRRILLDVDGPDWRVAFYYPRDYPAAGPHPLVLRAEQRRHASRRDAAWLESLAIARSSGRAPELRDALREAMAIVGRDRQGRSVHIEPSARELEVIALYVLEGRYARREGRSR